jgi:hypothetical protein
MIQDARRELPGDQRHVELLTGLVEGVGVTLEQAQVGMHARSWLIGERLGHEAGVYAALKADLLDHRAEGHDVVGRGQRVGVPQVDLVLAGPALVVRVLDRNAHLLEHVDSGAAEVHPRAARHMVEVSALVDRSGVLGPVLLMLEEVELDLRVHVEGEALLLGLGQCGFQHMARVAERRLAFGRENVAEHAGGALRAVAPRQNLEGRRIRAHDHIVLGYARHAFDGRAVKAQPLLECRLQLGRCDGDGLQCPQHIGEP